MADSLYLKYLKQFGYAPQNVNHLMAFGKEIGQPIKFKDARMTIKTPPDPNDHDEPKAYEIKVKYNGNLFTIYKDEESSIYTVNQLRSEVAEKYIHESASSLIFKLDGSIVNDYNQNIFSFNKHIIIFRVDLKKKKSVSKIISSNKQPQQIECKINNSSFKQKLKLFNECKDDEKQPIAMNKVITSVSVGRMKQKFIEMESEKHKQKPLIKVIKKKWEPPALLTAKCETCFGTTSDILPLYCTHQFCYECMTNYIKAQSDKTRIKCPLCGSDQFGSDISHNHYISLIKRSLDTSRHTYVKPTTCLTIGCRTLINPLIKRRFDCNRCGKRWCIRCKVPWHGNIDCDDFNKKNVSKEIGKEMIQYLQNCELKQIGDIQGVPSIRCCPKCFMPIYHVSNCKHVQCTQCNTSFCFVCMEIADESGWKCGSYDEQCPIAPIVIPNFVSELNEQNLSNNKRLVTVPIGCNFMLCEDMKKMRR
eukprot:466362_1